MERLGVCVEETSGRGRWRYPILAHVVEYYIKKYGMDHTLTNLRDSYVNAESLKLADVTSL